MSRHNSPSHTDLSSSVRHDRPSNAAVPLAAPTHDAIARRAYDLYVKGGSKQGQCKQNWQQAEQSFADAGPTAVHAKGCGCTACAKHSASSH